MLLGIAFFVFIREDNFTFKKEKIGLVLILLRPDFYFSLFRKVAGWDVEVDEGALDVNGDGSVNTKDAIALFRYVACWEGIVLHRGL